MPTLAELLTTPMTFIPNAPTTRLRISDYVAGEASGSGISDPRANSGYQPALVAELARICPYGGTITVDAQGLRDLAEWADCLSGAARQGGNPSGGRSLTNLATKAERLALELDRGGNR